MFLPTLFLISCHLTSGSSYTFLSIGDWGANTIPDRGSMSYQKNVGAVASQLTKSYQENDAKFVLNLVRTSSSEIRHTFLTHIYDQTLHEFQGDSFYWCGIQNTSDFQVVTDLAPYKDIKVDWYVVSKFL